MNYLPVAIATFEVLGEIDYISHKVDRFGRFILNEDVWVKYPEMESCVLYGNLGDVVDTVCFISLEKMCKEGMCYSNRFLSTLSQNGRLRSRE